MKTRQDDCSYIVNPTIKPTQQSSQVDGIEVIEEESLNGHIPSNIGNNEKVSTETKKHKDSFDESIKISKLEKEEKIVELTTQNK